MELLIEALLQAADLRSMGSFQLYEARDLYREALAMAHRGQHERIQTEAMLGLGSIYDALGLHPVAKNYAREGLGSAHLQKIHVLECQALNIMGRILQREKDYELARRCHLHALDIAREYQLKLYEAESLYHIGQVFGPRDPAAAISHYRQALAIADDTACLEQQYFIWGGLGDAYAHSRDFVSAFNAFDRMLLIASKNHNRLQEAFAFGAMGRTRLLQGEAEAALDDFAQMEVLSRENNNPLGEAAALEGQAQAQEKLLRYPLCWRPCKPPAFCIWHWKMTPPCAA
ncbi:MAG: tetratricopeptide repeat protein [Nitrospiraceae bacterium]|nr:tetratricopeptide repeat protein [Nitrospiraceae bacterium]